jgi:hypothetical protein
MSDSGTDAPSIEHGFRKIGEVRPLRTFLAWL